MVDLDGWYLKKGLFGKQFVRRQVYLTRYIGSEINSAAYYIQSGSQFTV